jgi:hypothetical protein
LRRGPDDADEVSEHLGLAHLFHCARVRAQLLQEQRADVPHVEQVQRHVAVVTTIGT